MDIDELVKLVTTGGLPTSDQIDDAPDPIAAEPIPAPVAEEPVAIPAPEPIAPPAPEPVTQTPVPAPVMEVPAPATPAPVSIAPAPTPEPTSAPVTLPPVTLPPAANPWVAKQAGDLDPNDATAVAQELTAQGISEAWANELIVAAAAHRSPLAGAACATRCAPRSRPPSPHRLPSPPTEPQSRLSAPAAPARPAARRRWPRRTPRARRSRRAWYRSAATTGAATSRSCSRDRTSG